MSGKDLAERLARKRVARLERFVRAWDEACTEAIRDPDPERIDRMDRLIRLTRNFKREAEWSGFPLEAGDLMEAILDLARLADGHPQAMGSMERTLRHRLISDQLGRLVLSVSLKAIGVPVRTGATENRPAVKRVKRPSKIREEFRVEIRKKRAEGARVKDLAKEYGVTPGRISQITGEKPRL